MKTLTRKRYTKRDIGEFASASALFAPYAILFLVFIVLPVCVALVLSFTKYSVVQDPIFVGFENFVYMFTEDDVFLTAMGNTFAFALISGIIGYLLSFIVAWVIDNVKGRMFFALMFYAPSITSSVAMSVVWLTFFSPDSLGYINYALMSMGLIENPLLWNQDPSLILPMVTIVSVWMGMGTGFLAFMAGFQNLDKQIREAGEIDGVRNKLEELIHIIFPQMKPMLLFGAVTTVTNSFATYVIPLTMAGSPGPENASLTLVGHIQDYAFVRMDLGYASAVSIFLFAITFAISRILFRVLAERD